MPAEANIRKIYLSGTKQKIYTQLNKDEAECELCKREGLEKCKIKTTQGNTKVLVSHLKAKHNSTILITRNKRRRVRADRKIYNYQWRSSA